MALHMIQIYTCMLETGQCKSTICTLLWTLSLKLFGSVTLSLSDFLKRIATRTEVLALRMEELCEFLSSNLEHLAPDKVES